jgi:hypothetical protein
MIWRVDGTKHGGPRGDYHGFNHKKSFKLSGISKGEGFVQIGVFRFQDVGDDTHFTIGTTIAADIFKKDGTVTNGPAWQFNKYWPAPTDIIDRCNDNVRADNIEFCGKNPPGGDGFIQVGSWRIGNVDGQHFSLSHKLGNTAIIYRSDGTVHGGPRKDFGLWDKPFLDEATNVVIGDRYIEFGGHWRLALTQIQHLSIGHKGGKTAFIWRADGARFGGPRDDFNGFMIEEAGPNYIRWTDRSLQIGEFRIVEMDPNHISIAGSMTSDIFRSDGTIHPGPRWDWNGNLVESHIVSRSKDQCKGGEKK